ncbi:MAG: hypothetical protein ABSB74_14605 [Tepidisphaeraceae bacterium]
MLTPRGSTQMVVRWRLARDAASIANGQRTIDPKKTTNIHLLLPRARARCELLWSYRLAATDTGKEIEGGEITIHLFPPIDFSQAMNLGARRLVILDPTRQIATLLRWQNPRAKILEIADASQLETARADILIIAPNSLEDSPLAQQPVLRQAESGAQLVIFEQTRCKKLAGYAVTTRPSQDIFWNRSHALLCGLNEADLNCWTEHETLYSLQLPTDASAEPLAWWPSQTPSKILMAIVPFGAGRVIFCQLPEPDLPADPRCQTILRNSLIYFQSAGSVSPPNQYCATQSAQAQLVSPTFPPAGVQP